MCTACLQFGRLTGLFPPARESRAVPRRPEGRAGNALRLAGDAQVRIEFYGAEDAGRAEIERFVGESFQRACGARIRSCMPRLLALRDAGGRLLAACGLRNAAAERLFLEIYFEQPIEAVLSGVTGEKNGRSDIVEVGNLAVADAGGARHLVAAIIDHLHATDAQWAVFTAVAALRNSFAKMGLQPLVLGEADKNCLDAASRAEWGDYYRHQPQVMAVRRISAGAPR